MDAGRETPAILKTFYINQQSGGPSTIICKPFNINVTVNIGQTAQIYAFPDGPGTTVYVVKVGTGIATSFRPLNNFTTLSNPVLTVNTSNSNINTSLQNYTIDATLTNFNIDTGGITYITNPNQNQVIYLATKPVETKKYVTTTAIISKPFYIDATLATVPVLVTSSGNIDKAINISGKLANFSIINKNDINTYQLTYVDSIPTLNSTTFTNVGETYTATNNGTTATVDGMILTNSIATYTVNNKKNLKIGAPDHGFIAIKLQIAPAAVGSTLTSITNTTFNKINGPKVYTFTNYGYYTIDNILDINVFIVKYYKSDNKLLTFTEPATSTIGSKIRFSNSTIESGDVIDTLYESTAIISKITVNVANFFNRTNLPQMIQPVNTSTLHLVQQLSTDGEHLRGGNQVENTVTVPVNTGYVMMPDDRTLILDGGDIIILPAISSTSTSLQPIIYVSPGTQINIYNSTTSTVASTISATEDLSQLTLQPNQSLSAVAQAPKNGAIYGTWLVKIINNI